MCVIEGVYTAIWTSLVAQIIKNLPVMGRPGFDPWVGKIPWRRERLPAPVFWPGEFHGQTSPWGHKESDRTERTFTHSLKQSIMNPDSLALREGGLSLEKQIN